jgi:ABC transporter substrate binding protein
VFVTVSDPLGQGFVQSFARPNGNITGFSNLEYSLIGKWLQLLKEAAPRVTQVGLMISTNASSPKWYQMFKAVAPTLAIDRPLGAKTSGPETGGGRRINRPTGDRDHSAGKSCAPKVSMTVTEWPIRAQAWRLKCTTQRIPPISAP